MATHLACAFILYKIIYLLTDKSVIAAAGTVIWGICPINYGVLAWYSCHGIILVGFFFLLFLYDLIKIEKQKMSLTSTIAIKWSILLALMASSYGSGLIISCLAPIAVVIILWENKNKWKFAAWMLPVIALIMFQFIFKDNIYYYFSGEIQTQKPLSLCNPLNHCGIILEMFVRICTYSIYCMAAFPMLFIPSTRDHPAAPFHVSMPLEYPIAPFLVSILVIIILIECFLHCSDSKKRYLGVLTLFLLCLAFFIALGRAPIYKIVSISIDEASLTPRYYYIIFFITIMILALMADMLINRFPEASKWTGPCILAVIAISIYPSAKLANKIDPWNQFEKEKKLYFETVNEIKKIIETSPKAAPVFIDNKMNNHFSIFLPAATDFPGKAAVFSITYSSNTLGDRRVYFIEQNCHVANKNIEKKKWRISSLMLSACNINFVDSLKLQNRTILNTIFVQ